MKLYARMSQEKRRLLLSAALVIAQGTILFDDTGREGDLETRMADFDSKT